MANHMYISLCQRAYAEVQWKETEVKTIHMVGAEGKVNGTLSDTCGAHLTNHEYIHEQSST